MRVEGEPDKQRMRTSRALLDFAFDIYRRVPSASTQTHSSNTSILSVVVLSVEVPLRQLRR